MGIKKSDALLDIVDLEMEEDNQLTISFDF